MELKTVPTHRVAVQYLEGGSGEPLVFLHGAGGMQPNDPFLETLAESFHVYAPSCPAMARARNAARSATCWISPCTTGMWWRPWG